MAKTKAVDESLSLIEKAQRGLLKRLQKMVDDGASKADLDKVAGNAAGGNSNKPGYLQRIKDAEGRAIDFFTRQKRTKTGQPIRSVKRVDDNFGRRTGREFGSKKDTGYKVKRGAARAIVYGTPIVGLSKSGNALSKAEQAKKSAADNAATSTVKPKQKSKAEKEKAILESYKKGDKIRANRAASSSKKGKGKLFPKFRPFGGVLARALLGDDEKFGGERGAIDFIRTKKKKTTKTPTSEKRKSDKEAILKAQKRQDKNLAASAKAKIRKKVEDDAAKRKVKGINMGGMMKKKGYAKGGMAKKGYAKGGPAKKNMGGSMKKKGYAMGGMTKKGYANGGMAKKGYANGGSAKKTATRGKARGVGAATRGFGKAMKK